VNLIVPRKVNCIPDVIVPVGIAAHDMRLDPERVRIATEVLMTTGRVKKKSSAKI
jgi:hypothetical protein